MLFASARVAVDEFERRTGWQVKPEGLCRDDTCVPLAASGGRLDLADVARVLHMPLVPDAAAGLWSLGPPANEHAIRNAQMPELVLPDVHGAAFDIRSLRGKKVLLLAWASW
jgi:hypothetical protein